MQQRQLRLGDILDDYCPRERRLTNHAVVAMVGPDVKQTRCTTCDAEHDYKHAKVPRQRRKAETTPALYAQVLAGGPKRVVHEAQAAEAPDKARTDPDPVPEAPRAAADSPSPVEAPEPGDGFEEGERDDEGEEEPVHRPLIRATLPRLEGQPPPPRQGPDFTIRQPAGRPHRFRGRHPQGNPQFPGNRAGGGGGMGGPARGGTHRQNSGRPQTPSHSLTRHGQQGRKRSK
jgi:hypothetical protein